jgi:hypothetical protein
MPRPIPLEDQASVTQRTRIWTLQPAVKSPYPVAGYSRNLNHPSSSFAATHKRTLPAIRRPCQAPAPLEHPVVQGGTADPGGASQQNSSASNFNRLNLTLRGPFGHGARAVLHALQHRLSYPGCIARTGGGKPIHQFTRPIVRCMHPAFAGPPALIRLGRLISP